MDNLHIPVDPYLVSLEVQNCSKRKIWRLAWQVENDLILFGMDGDQFGLMVEEKRRPVTDQYLIFIYNFIKSPNFIKNVAMLWSNMCFIDYLLTNSCFEQPTIKWIERFELFFDFKCNCKYQTKINYLRYFFYNDNKWLTTK